MNSLRERIEGLVAEHRFEQYSLRCGCSCGWGTTLHPKQESWGKWAGHIAELAAALAAEGPTPASSGDAVKSWDYICSKHRLPIPEDVPCPYCELEKLRAAAPSLHKTFKGWWLSEGIKQMPRSNEPPEHAHIAELAWNAALAREIIAPSLDKEVTRIEVCGMCGEFLEGDFCTSCQATVDEDARDTAALHKEERNMNYLADLRHDLQDEEFALAYLSACAKEGDDTLRIGIRDVLAALHKEGTLGLTLRKQCSAHVKQLTRKHWSGR